MTTENSTESSASSHLSDVMTTTGVAQITGENTVTSSSSRGIEFYFQCAALVIGVLGTAANAFILYALMASKQHKTHLLIVHQNALDLFASFFMTVTYIIRLCNLNLSGSVGYWLCSIILTECLSWWGTFASAINLAIITVERYLRVVYPVCSKNKLRNWMIYSAMATAWIVSFISNVVVAFPTSGVIDGVCYAYTIWNNKTASMFYYIYNFLSFYVIILFIFVFCYWRILVAIRRLARVAASHAAEGLSAAQNQLNQIESSVTKTMIFVSACYAISWLPSYIHFLTLTLHPYPLPFDGIYYATVLLAYSYLFTNPLIYATNLDAVKEVLLSLIPCQMIYEEADDNVAAPMELQVA